MQIIPSILVPDETTFTKQMNAIRGVLPMIQLDIADGEFVPNTTWANPDVVEKVAGNIDVELHMMVADPLKEIERWTEVSQIRRVLFHYESNADIRKTCELIHANDWLAAVVLNPDTPVSVLDPYLDMLDGVMFMGVYPGKQGQAFIPKTLTRIKEFKAKETTHFVELDGAVNLDTLPDIVPTDIDAVCPGSATWKNDDPATNVANMQEIINRLTPQA